MSFLIHPIHVLDHTHSLHDSNTITHGMLPMMLLALDGIESVCCMLLRPMRLVRQVILLLTSLWCNFTPPSLHTHTGPRLRRRRHSSFGQGAVVALEGLVGRLVVVVRESLDSLPALVEWGGGTVWRWDWGVVFWNANDFDCVVQVNGVFVAMVVFLLVLGFFVLYAFLEWMHELVK